MTNDLSNWCKKPLPPQTPERALILVAEREVVPAAGGFAADTTSSEQKGSHARIVPAALRGEARHLNEVIYI
jgi:hypothetical protein